MTDTATNQPLQVETDTIDGKYSWIILPVSQLDTVRAILDVNSVPYWVSHSRVSVNRGPFMAKIYLRLKADPRLVQA